MQTAGGSGEISENGASSAGGGVDGIQSRPATPGSGPGTGGSKEKKRRRSGGFSRKSPNLESPSGDSDWSRGERPAPLSLLEDAFHAVGDALSPVGMGLRAAVNPLAIAARKISRARKRLLTTPTAAAAEGRTAAARMIHMGMPNPGFVNNTIKTSKYNIITFFPIFLFEMFSRAAYLYFLVQACLAWWEVVSPFGGWGSTLALLFVLGVAAIKALFEDIKRHQQDAVTNNSIAHLVNAEDGTVSEIKWRDVAVGQILRVNDDELFPADLICLYSKLDENVCFIKTTNLDGETNLKIRKPVDLREDAPTTWEDTLDIRGELNCEPPNANLHKFNGRLTVTTSSQSERVVPLTTHELLLRECMLKNSGFILGVVVYTGKESRIQMNSAKTPNKVGSYDHFLNFQIAFVMLLQLAMCIFCAIASLIWRNSLGRYRYFLALESQTQGNYTNGVAYTLILFITFWILFSYLVPISLFVTLEIVKFWQGFVYVNWDKEMIDPATGEHASARNTNLNEDLGKIDYVFSDKTGTLTSNEMQMRQISIKGVIFGDLDLRLEDSPDLEGGICLERWDPRLTSAAKTLEDSGAWAKLVNSGGSPARTLALPSSRDAAADGELERKPSHRSGSSPQHHSRDSKGGGSTPAAYRSGGYGSITPGSPGRHSSLGVSNVTPPSNGASEDGGEADGVGNSRGPSGSMDLGSKPDLPNSVESGTKSALSGSGAEEAGKKPPESEVLASHMLDFWMNICICHSLIVEKGEKGEIIYQGPSPDEVALVEGARKLGFRVLGRTQNGIQLDLLGQEATFEVLNVVEYSSARARMSIISRAPDGTIRLFCKGSDARVLASVRKDTPKLLLDATDTNLHSFATKGLRTLALGSKVLARDFWEGWDARYQQAAALLEGRDEALAALADEVEADLELVGVSAIEDKLQDGVPEAIQTLLDAGMRVWVITGDKQETAINIAISCKLIRRPDDLLVCNAHSYDEAAARLRQLLDIQAARLQPHGHPHPLPVIRDGPVLSDLHIGELVIDGATLSAILGTDLEQHLAVLGAGCSAVVICRSSPSQKAGVVRMMTEYEMRCAEGGSRGLLRWYRRQMKKQAGRMLAIGDGANDVAMIQAADVGVGIMGKEGRQAVNNADFAISQFRFLVRLLLVHGSLDAYRLSRLIKYSFYKNVAFGLMLFYYQFYCGFSGQAMVDDITAAAFNVLFTSWPILIFAVMDRPVKKLSTLMRFPQTYNQGGSLTTATFWKNGVGMAAVDAALSFFITYYAMDSAGGRDPNDVYSVGQTAYVAILGAVTLEMCIVARYWTVWFALLTFLSYALVFAFAVAYPRALEAMGTFNVAQYSIMVALLQNGAFWLTILAVYLAVFGHRYAERAFVWLFTPQDNMILEELEVSEQRNPEQGWQTDSRLQKLQSRLGTTPDEGEGDLPLPPLPTSRPPSRQGPPWVPTPVTSRPTTPAGGGIGRTSLLRRVSGALTRMSASEGEVSPPMSRPASPGEAATGVGVGADARGRSVVRRAWERIRRDPDREQAQAHAAEEVRIAEAAATVRPGAVAQIRESIEGRELASRGGVDPRDSTRPGSPGDPPGLHHPGGGGALPDVAEGWADAVEAPDEETHVFGSVTQRLPGDIEMGRDVGEEPRTEPVP